MSHLLKVGSALKVIVIVIEVLSLITSNQHPSLMGNAKSNPA